jgi:hypothetical protein
MPATTLAPSDARCAVRSSGKPSPGECAVECAGPGTGLGTAPTRRLTLRQSDTPDREESLPGHHGANNVIASPQQRFASGSSHGRPFIFIATNKVRDGKLDDEKNRVPGWVQFIHDNEPRTIGFHEYRSADGTEVEYIQIHPDTDSFEHHMRVLAEKSDLSYKETLEGTTDIRIYGQPTEVILDMLKQAAGVGVPVTILPEHLGGFARS